MSLIDYGGNRWLDETLESDLTGDSITRVNAVTENTGFETLTYREEKPYYRVFSIEDVRSLRVRKLRRHPEGVLQMALGRPETLECEADVWDPISLELDIAGLDTVRMAKKIQELRLQVERIIPVHGVPTTISALNRGLAVRAKYIP